MINSKNSVDLKVQKEMYENKNEMIEKDDQQCTGLMITRSVQKRESYPMSHRK